MIVTANGDNIAPVPIESLIKEDMPIISNVVLIGDHMEYLVCLITLKVSQGKTMLQWNLQIKNILGPAICLYREVVLF